MRRNTVSKAAVVAVVMCAGGVASAQWTGPFDADQRIQYIGGRVLVGGAAPGNSKVLLDAVEPAGSGRDIAIHAFAGTPISGIRTTAIWGETNNPSGRALQGFNFAATGTGAGVWAETASVAGTGIRARATAGTGGTYGGYFDAASTNGTGVFGVATSTAGPNIGVWGSTASAEGYAGYFTGGMNYFQGYVGLNRTVPKARLHIGAGDGGAAYRSWMTDGMYVATDSDAGFFGIKNEGGNRQDTVVTFGDDSDDNLRFIFTQSGGPTNGVEYMRISGAGNVGIGNVAPSSPLTVNGSTSQPVVSGANATTAGGGSTSGPSGVTGTITSGSPGSWSAGVWGINNGGGGSGIGVAGYQAGTGFGVYGKTGNASGYAGYFDGRVTVTGTLSKGGGSFKIDHPLDPENKYLYHSFVESPDMMNIYNGNVTTDGSGIATITMPAWFETLNRDFRYQLTVIDDGGEWAQARVFRKMDHNSFMVQTNRPYIEVSWQVTGIRQDKWANANRIPVEQEKEPQNHGKYLHWREYGQPESKSLTAQFDPNWVAPAPAPAAIARPAASVRPAQATVPARTAPVSNEPPLRPAQGSASR